MTICNNCQFCLRLIRNEVLPDVWYNFQCKASPRPEAIDPVTGIKGFSGCNDLGTKYINDQRYDYCRDINTDGNCKLFRSKNIKIVKEV